MSAVKEEKKMETKETFWTTTEKETSKELYGTEILVENGSLDEVMTTDAPSDAWVVTYEIDGTVHRDLTRGSRVKLFDMYSVLCISVFLNLTTTYGSLEV